MLAEAPQQSVLIHGAICEDAECIAKFFGQTPVAPNNKGTISVNVSTDPEQRQSFAIMLSMLGFEWSKGKKAFVQIGV